MQYSQVSRTNTVKIVGVINLTPDSFSDGGKFCQASQAIAHAEHLLAVGADIIELGAESTAPGSKPVGPELEWARLQGVLPEIARCCPLAVDTYRSQTARKALQAGAQIVNDVSGLRYDEDMANVIAAAGAQVVIMHSKQPGNNPHVDDNERSYNDPASEIAEFLLERADFAASAGIAHDRIILDPGMGRFISNDPEVSWLILKDFERLVELLRPYPVMIATSRKGFLGGELSGRDPLSQLTAIIASQKGASYIRTHNVSMCRQFQNTWQKLCGANYI